MSGDPFRPVDDEARALAGRLMTKARHGALAVILEGEPLVTRIAVAPEKGALLTLVSDLATHTGALRAASVASLLIGDPGRGDPLAHPRMTLQVVPEFLEKSEEVAARYLKAQPKAQLYIGFADFHLVRLQPQSALLNGGFGKAFRMAASDLKGETG